MNDIEIMQTALELAAKGRGYTSPNPMVGAVLVKDGRIVGRGYHEAVGKAHAEVNAIAAAGSLAAGAVMYVTLEPCNHQGRTPPCTEKIVAAGVKEVVVAMRDPNPHVAGGGIAYLANRGIKVRVGVCQTEAEKLNESFIKFVTIGRPFVMLKFAATLDGRIATRSGDSRWVTGPAARTFVHRLRHGADAVMVGIETVRRDDPSLTTRLEGEDGKDPIRVILDTRLSISEDASILRLKSDSATIIITGAGGAEEKKSRLAKMGARVVEAPLKEGRIDLDKLMDRLASDGITSLLIEGGAAVGASALKAGIVDKVFFFYAPKILGGDDGVPICRGAGPEWMRECVPVRDIEVRRFGDDVLIEGYIDKGKGAVRGG